MSKTLTKITIIFLASSFLVFAGVLAHVLSNSWSGIASIGLFAILLLSVPFLIYVLVKQSKQERLVGHERLINWLSKIFVVSSVIAGFIM